MQRLFYAPPLPRTRLPFRAVTPKPHDSPVSPLHSSRLALQLRVRNTRFHDIDPWLSSLPSGMSTDLWRYPRLNHRTDDQSNAKASGAPRPQLPEERPGRRLPPLLASSPESPYRSHAGQPSRNSRKSVTVHRSEFTSGGKRGSFPVPIRTSCRRHESCRNSQARLPPPASGAIGGLRYSVSEIMPAENQYTPLRFPRPFASYGGATLCSMYCLTAGLEITSGGWRGLFPIPLRTHRLFCHAACRNSRANVAPGRRVLLLPLVISCPQSCRTTAPQLPEERHGSPDLTLVFRFGVPPATAYHAAYACGHVPHCSGYLTAHQPVPSVSRRRVFSIVCYPTSGVLPVLHNQNYVLGPDTSGQAGYSFT
jgi:hypothetical protein